MTPNSKNKTNKKTTKKATNNSLVKKQIKDQQQFSISLGDSKEAQSATILANEYFNGVKTKQQKIIDSKIFEELKYLPNQIEELIMLGQTGLANKLKKNIVNLTKERILIANGFDTYLYRNDVTRYIELVKDKKVFICELEKFPRLIPESAKKLLMKARSLNVFKDFWVVYVDYTGDSDKLLTKQEIAERRKNRDPIIFGTFERPENEPIDKMYFICDWVDEYCDLTLDKMVKKLVENDQNYKPQTIVEDINGYINKILMEDDILTGNIKVKPTFTEKVKNFFGIK